MSIEFTCQACGRELRAADSAAGRKVRCPDCATLLLIPDPSEPDDESAGLASDMPDEEGPPTSAHEFDELDIGATAAMGPLEELKPLPLHPPPPPPAEHDPQGQASRRASNQREGEAPAEPSGAPSGLSGSAEPPPRKPHSPFDDTPLIPPTRPHPEDLIDMTAMVDIVFFLLIFFLVTSMQALEAVMNLPTPQSSEAGVSTGKSVADLENDPNFITVRIEDDDSIWVESTQVFNDQELARKLRDARQESDRPRSLLVIGDADASHGTAVRVFDAGAGAGVSGISLVVQEKENSGR